MDLSYYAPWINTILLVILFLYQKNKNKVLIDRIEQQSFVLSETKEIISHQSISIENQKKIVDTALEYASKFNAGKIESILRREIEIEHKYEFDKLKEANFNNSDERNYLLSLRSELIEAYNNVKINLSNLQNDMIQPCLDAFFNIFFSLPIEHQKKFIYSIKDSKFKDLLREIYFEVEKGIISEIAIGSKK